MSEPTNIVYTHVGTGRVLHAKSELPLNPRSVVVCGAAGEPAGATLDADSRAIRVAGKPVCGNCRSLLDTGGVRPMLSEPTKSARTSAEGSTTMAPATTERQKAKSRDLLDPRKLKDTSDKRLREERATLNNRLSGVSTQLKRLGDSRAAADAAKRRELKARQDDLLTRRDAVNSELAGREEPAPSSNGNAKLAAATKTAGKELSKASSRNPRGRRATKRGHK